jgi:hypothetical protein
LLAVVKLAVSISAVTVTPSARASTCPARTAKVPWTVNRASLRILKEISLLLGQIS